MAYCSNCGHQISEQALACPSCGHPGPSSRTSTIAIGGIAATGDQLADYGQRVGAYFIDLLIIVVPSVVISTTFLFGNRPWGGVVFLPFIWAPIGVLYKVLLEGSERGQTVGKMALKIQVRDAAAGGPIGYGRAFIRWIASFALGFAFYVGTILDLVWPLWDRKRQTLHDKAAQSVVTKVLF